MKRTLPVAWDVLYPNAIAEVRVMRGYQSLMALSRAIPQIPYARLYKLERGTSIARESEITIIAKALRTRPATLMLSSMDAEQAQAWADSSSVHQRRVQGGDRQSVILAAAIRYEARRRTYLGRHIIDILGIPWSTYHKMINAERPIDRWSDRAMLGIMKMMEVRSWDAVILRSQKLHESGVLSSHLQQVTTPRTRFHPDDPDARAPWTKGVLRKPVERHPTMTPAQRSTRYRDRAPNAPRSRASETTATGGENVRSSPPKTARFPRESYEGTNDQKTLASAIRITQETGEISQSDLVHLIHENAGITVGQAWYAIGRLTKSGALPYLRTARDLVIRPPYPPTAHIMQQDRHQS